MDVRKIRKVGLWVIIGATLLVLLGLNLTGNAQYLDKVVYIALVVLVVWLLAMAIWSRFSR